MKATPVRRTNNNPRATTRFEKYWPCHPCASTLRGHYLRGGSFFFSSSPSFSFPIHLDSADQTEFLPACFNWKEGVCYVTESRATPQKPRTRDVASDSAFTVAIIARRNEFFLSFFFCFFFLARGERARKFGGNWRVFWYVNS